MNYDYFNAVAKGYAVDIVSSKFKELNIEDFFINIGGEIRAEGMKNNNFWKIGIENPLPNQQGIFRPLSLNKTFRLLPQEITETLGILLELKETKELIKMYCLFQ